MLHLTRASAVGLLSLLTASMAAQQIDPDAASARVADAYLKTELSAKRVPGMSVCVVRHGKVVLANGYGFANVELSTPASEHTIFELASVTKPVHGYSNHDPC
jgi:CubicO group peptidase (beta-lactamase class C family)